MFRSITFGTLRMSSRAFNINDYRGRLLLNVLGHNFRLILSYHNGDYKSALKLLEITAECEEAEIRKAYLDKAKVCHPDLSDSADPKQFAKVQDAYKLCMQEAKRKQKMEEVTAESLEEELNTLDHSLAFSGGKSRKLQHRHYLEYTAGASGSTIYQRHKAHQQEKYASATEAMFEHNVQKHLENKEETSLATVDKKQQDANSDIDYTRRQKFSKGMDRLINDLILESMSRGEFNNLPGVGRPLPQLQEPENPVLDRTTERLNKILVNTGFAPQWVTLNKDINTEVKHFKRRICVKWNRVGPFPMSLHNTRQWETFLSECEIELAQINKMVDKFNLIVPVLDQQKTHYQLKKIVVQVLTDNPINISNQNNDTGPVVAASTNQWIVDLRPSKLYKLLISRLTQK